MRSPSKSFDFCLGTNVLNARFSSCPGRLLSRVIWLPSTLLQRLAGRERWFAPLSNLLWSNFQNHWSSNPLGYKIGLSATSLFGYPRVHLLPLHVASIRKATTMYLSASVLALATSVLAAPSSFLSTYTSWPTDLSWLHAMQKRAAKKTCHAQALGGGQDDSSSIISAFNQCQNNSIIILDGNYTGELSCPAKAIP